MSTNSRMSVAVHGLAWIAYDRHGTDKEIVTSERIANGVNTPRHLHQWVARPRCACRCTCRLAELLSSSTRRPRRFIAANRDELRTAGDSARCELAQSHVAVPRLPSPGCSPRQDSHRVSDCRDARPSARSPHSWVSDGGSQLRPSEGTCRNPRTGRGDQRGDSSALMSVTVAP
jgi:hypothetical protein